MITRRKFLQDSIRSSIGLSGLLLLPARLLASEMPADITELSASDLSTAIRQKDISCAEVMRAYLDRIHRYNPVYNAIVSMLDDDELLNQATVADDELARGEYRGWMHGMPHAIKDVRGAAGLTFTSGSPLYADRIADVDHPLAAAIRGAGAIFIGKTNVPEFGLGSQSYNPVFGATGSAWNPALTSGGSSGGAASGLGTHMLPSADGSDTMGSLRNPGAFNGVIGFRPSIGVTAEQQPGERSISTTGPMGRNTADTIQLLKTLAVKPVAENYSPMDLSEVRIGWMGNLDGYLSMESGVTDICEESLNSLSAAAVKVDAVKPQFNLSDLWLAWTTIRHSGRTGYHDLYNDPEARALLKPELKWEIEQSFMLTDGDRRVANRIRSDWYRELDLLFDEYDFLAIPSAQVFPYPKENHWPQEIAGRRMDTYHRWMEVVILASMGGIPVINLPVGTDALGRPMGMQIMGRFGDDKRVLEFALAYEQVTDYVQRRPQLVDAN
ncbi:MAG: amidase [Pseudomonadales bacterium]|nr:amidase [Pseudomonadales bacterium]